MGFFFKSKRNTKNTSDNNITIHAENQNSIESSINLLYEFMKEFKRDIKENMNRLMEEVKHTAQRIEQVERRVDNAEVRIKVLEEIYEKSRKRK